jgi:hypothetical protein
MGEDPESTAFDGAGPLSPASAVAPPSSPGLGPAAYEGGAGLVTGEDATRGAINFFMQHGVSSAVKFALLVQAVSKLRFRSYGPVVVTEQGASVDN